MNAVRTLIRLCEGCFGGAVATYASIWCYALAAGEVSSVAALSPVVVALFLSGAIRAVIHGGVIGAVASLLEPRSGRVAALGSVTLAVVAGALCGYLASAAAPHVRQAIAISSSAAVWGLSAGVIVMLSVIHQRAAQLVR